MTGKELKEFANRLADDAAVEVHTNCAPSYRTDWNPLQAKHIRAVVVAAVEAEEEAAS